MNLNMNLSTNLSTNRLYKCMIATAAIVAVNGLNPSAVCAQGGFSPAMAQQATYKGTVPPGQAINPAKPLPNLGRQYVDSKNSSGRLGARGYQMNSIGDFPLPKLNFPRETKPH